MCEARTPCPSAAANAKTASMPHLSPRLACPCRHHNARTDMLGSGSTIRGQPTPGQHKYRTLKNIVLAKASVGPTTRVSSNPLLLPTGDSHNNGRSGSETACMRHRDPTPSRRGFRRSVQIINNVSQWPWPRCYKTTRTTEGARLFLPALRGIARWKATRSSATVCLLTARSWGSKLPA